MSIIGNYLLDNIRRFVPSFTSVLINDGDKKYFNDELLRHMRERNNKQVEYILKNKNPGDLIDSSQSTLLHYSAKYGATNLIGYLVGIGCNVDAQDELGKTPLMFAVEENHVTTVDALIINNANLYITDKQSKSALQLAFDSKTYRSLHIIERCLDEVVKQCGSDNAEIAKKLIEANCPLHFAVFLKNVVLSKILIDHGLSLNSRDHATGETALHVAAKLTDVENVKLLVACGAEVNAKDVLGKMPFVNPTDLKIANSDRDFEILKILLDHGMQLTSLNYKGELQFTRLRYHDKKFIELIFDYDFDFLTRDSKDNNILHYFSVSKSVDFKKLDGKSVDINLRNKDGQTALQLAFKHDNENLVDFLLYNGAKIDYPNDQLLSYLTPLGIIERIRNGSSWVRHMCGKENPQFITTFMRYDEGIQFVLKYQEKIFDYSLKYKNNMTEFVLALIAMLIASDTQISENILETIRNDEYFAQCVFRRHATELEQMKNEIVYESVNLFKLLTEDKDKIVMYMRNQTIVERFMDIERNLESNSYYVDVLRKRVNNAIRIIELRYEAEIIFGEIIGMNINASTIIAERVFEYLDERDWKNLLFAISSK